MRFTCVFLLSGVLTAEVVINEVHYNAEPNTAKHEFVELYNSGGDAVDVSGWFFQQGVGYTIPGGTMIGAGEYLVVAESPSEMSADYGVVALGPYEGKLSSEGETIELRRADGTVADRVSYRSSFPWPVAANGTGSSMELIDTGVDNDLGGAWRSSDGAVPTPKAVNSSWVANAAPLVRQVDHSPKSPSSGENVVITAKVSDDEGVSVVMLEVQTVAPGDYVPAFLSKTTSQLLSNPTGPRTVNPEYVDSVNWTSIAMVDDGSGVDAVSGDGVYSALVTGEENRTLVRYRISASDGGGRSVSVPYEDDPRLNFAYFVYDGVPDYVASTRSLLGTGYVHEAADVSSVPVYHVLTTDGDFDQAVGYQSGDRIPSNNFDARSEYHWNCTFVYDGEVFDHARYRLRQRNARYSGGGKRSFKFRFNRGNYPTFRDADGKKYPEAWKFLATHKMTGSRSNPTWGMDQAVNHKMWNLTGTAAPHTHWFNMRVIRGAEEAPGQYNGDYFGMLLAVEEYDKRFLDAHDLEKGNLYKLISYRTNGLDVQRYQAAEGVSDGSDFSTIINQLRPGKTDAWLREHVNFDHWNRYHAVVDFIRHYDVQPNTAEHLKNRAYYFEPSESNPLGRLNVLPWDSDTSWGPNWNAGIDFVKASVYGNAGNQPREPYNIEYLNVMREMRDLLWTEEQIDLLIEPLASKIKKVVPIDRDRWRAATGGSQTDPSLESVTAGMKKFAFDGGTWVGGDNGSMPLISRDTGISGQEGRVAYVDALVADAQVPERPVITYTGGAGFPADGLRFGSSAFSDPQGAGSFAAQQWRLAEVTIPGGSTTEIMALDAMWRYLDDGSDQGVAWRASGFDDSGWALGAAPAGYGGVNGLTFNTTVGFGSSAFDRHETTYFRTTVTVDDPEAAESVVVKLLLDDGAVLYVNGVEVLRDGFFESTLVNFDTLADESGNEGEFDEYEIDPSFFVPGVNVIALEVHQKTTSSSDMGFGMTMEVVEPVVPPGKKPQFEWAAEWDSGVLDSFVSEIDFPAVAKVGRTYRARVRHQDSSGRWSHWSEPVQFEAGASAIQAWLDGLVISEVMYHPKAPTAAELAVDPTLVESDFEWVEIMNVGLVPLDLGLIRISDGVEFHFVNGSRQFIEPGERLVIVGHEAAFNLRYGYPTTPDFVVGVFDKNLANEGEAVRLSYGQSTPIVEFDYEPKLPWPSAADGDGRSLVYVLDPSAALDPGMGESWRGSVEVGGSPGLSDSSVFSGDPNGDDDGDGLPNLVDYAVVDGLELQINAEGYAELSYERVLGADDVVVFIEEGLENWVALGSQYELVEEVFGVGATSRLVYRSHAPVDGKEFFRLKVVRR